MNRGESRWAIRSSLRAIRRDRIDTWKDRMTVREPAVAVVGSGMPACGHQMTTWFDVIAPC